MMPAPTKVQPSGSVRQTSQSSASPQASIGDGCGQPVVGRVTLGAVHFIEALDKGVDLGAQSKYIIYTLEAHKEDIKRDILS